VYIFFSALFTIVNV